MRALNAEENKMKRENEIKQMGPSPLREIIIASEKLLEAYRKESQGEINIEELEKIKEDYEYVVKMYKFRGE